ncbi:MAG: nucleotidyltransferase domain-containing protein [Peptococcaceae bacterium]|jgi:predicted nucleotidyltransferase|nr:nucleotidyltransferase domain-containing protein [Peptococcaceae bacterium]
MYVSEEELKIVRQILRKHVPTAQVRLFGSRFGGKVKTFSDLDLAIAADGRLPWSLLLQMKEDFAESDLPYRVDLVDYSAVSDAFRRIIDGGNELIWPEVTGE